MSFNPLAALLRHDRVVLISGLAVATIIAWSYLLLGGIQMAAMAPDGIGMAMGMALSRWTIGHAAIVFVMWAVMMVAMMLPSAAPSILLIAALARQRAGGGGVAARTAGPFAAGYLLVWVAFSVVATALQWALSEAGMLSPVMATTNQIVAAGVLIAAGVWQWTPLKQACLHNCRSPLGILLTHWQRGPLGPVRSGAVNGLYCLGCCWLLMALLFVGGVMNILWIAGLALLVLIEKTTPWGERAAKVAGAVLAAWGLAALAPLL
ncbi:MAG: DUF2182 domain-containing protein [Acetobacteraceae bacterium]